MTYYLKAKSFSGQDVILKIRVHHGDIEYVEEMTEEELQKEIQENSSETFCCKCGKDITHGNQIAAGGWLGQLFQCEECWKKEEKGRAG